MFQKIKSKIKYLFLKKVKPEIIGGFKNANGFFSKNTGISNFTHISQKANNLFIDDHVFIGHFNYIDGFNAKVTICKNVQITNYVNILTHSSHHSIRFCQDQSVLNSLPPEILTVGEIYIGENTYIGPHSVLMPGTKIGKGCIVSAFSYVKGEFPDYSIIRGVPAKVIGNTKDIDSDLLKKFPELSESYYLKNEIN